MELKMRKNNHGTAAVSSEVRHVVDEPEVLIEEAGIHQAMSERIAWLENVINKIGSAVTPDAHSPQGIAQKVEAAGVGKGKLNTLSTVLLGILAGVFIGLGAMLYTVVTTNTGLGFGLTKLLGGLVFCLGLILTVVAGAELFTGNSLIVMSWISGRTKFTRLLRNWGLVYFANLVGSLSLVGLMYLTSQWAFSNNAVGANALLIANGKVNLGFGEALVRGILCNVLVCLAIWLCFSARTVVDKIMAIVFPITAFVAAGFEHSIANMYFIPMGILLTGQSAVVETAGVTAGGLSNLTWTGFVGNLIPVTIGNIIGGGILIAAVYWLAYMRGERTVELMSARPWLKKATPRFIYARLENSVSGTLSDTVRAQLEELIRAKQEQTPALLDAGGQALLTVLSRASTDRDFMARLSQNPEEALQEYRLTNEEKAALASGDIKWIESRIGKLEEPLRTWLDARLAQEKW
jgi:formate/nitrite transporter